MLVTVRPDHQDSGTVGRQSGASTMEPVGFSGCFGWLHRPSLSTSPLAVVLCPALGWEARWAHRATRKLADQLAQAGLPTLRFDYPSTGNSRDLHENEDPLSAWQDSVHAAIDWIRGQSGAGQVVLAGLRFGALLAADAAASRTDVAALALLAPVMSGRAYIRDLRVMARAVRHPVPGQAGRIDLDGVLLSDAAMRALAGLSLGATADGVPTHAMVLDVGGQASAYAAALHARGVEVTSAEFTGYAELMRCATENVVPYGALARVTDWISGLPTREAARPGSVPPRPILPVAVHRPGCVERPMRFGPGGALFGMLCRPDTGPMPEFAVVIGNTGGDPQHGIGRFGVVLSRCLARLGIATLRLDFAGLGDSRRRADDDAGHVFETDRQADVAAALDALSQLGVQRFGIAGICSGAYHALHAAAADERIVAAALLNLVTFTWITGDTTDPVSRNNQRSTRFYLDGLRRAETWRRLLRGEVHVHGIGQALAARAGRRAMLAVQRLVVRLGVRRLVSGPHAMMRTLSARGTRVLMLLGFDDPSVDALEEQFGPGGRTLLELPGIAIQVERDLDHNVSTQPMRERAAASLAAFFGDVAATPAASLAAAAAPADRGVQLRAA